jgi:hypothetical protein
MEKPRMFVIKFNDKHRKELAFPVSGEHDESYAVLVHPASGGNLRTVFDYP